MRVDDREHLAVNVLVRVKCAEGGWHVDMDVPTPEKSKLMAAKHVAREIRRKDKAADVEVTEKGNVLVRVLPAV